MQTAGPNLANIPPRLSSYAAGRAAFLRWQDQIAPDYARPHHFAAIPGSAVRRYVPAAFDSASLGAMWAYRAAVKETHNGTDRVFLMGFDDAAADAGAAVSRATELRPFDLTAAMRGAPVWTRDCQLAEFVAYTPRSEPWEQVTMRLPDCAPQSEWSVTGKHGDMPDDWCGHLLMVPACLMYGVTGG